MADAFLRQNNRVANPLWVVNRNFLWTLASASDCSDVNDDTIGFTTSFDNQALQFTGESSSYE